MGAAPPADMSGNPACAESDDEPEYVLGADDERWLRETLPDAVRKKLGAGARAEAQKGRSHKKGAGKAAQLEQQKAEEEPEAGGAEKRAEAGDARQEVQGGGPGAECGASGPSSHWRAIGVTRRQRWRVAAMACHRLRQIWLYTTLRHQSDDVALTRGPNRLELEHATTHFILRWRRDPTADDTVSITQAMEVDEATQATEENVQRHVNALTGRAPRGGHRHS